LRRLVVYESRELSGKIFWAGTLSDIKKETMMRKFLKWLGIVVGGLVVLLVLVVVTLGLLG